MKTIKLYETLGSLLDLQLNESTDGLMHLEGVFGLCGVKNNNNRIYDRDNYAEMIEALQDKIAAKSLLGELEHSYSGVTSLENVSHRIDSLSIDEDGVVHGSLTLLNTPKGQIAQAIIKAGSPLFVSSKAVGTMDENGNVTLTRLFTYDIVCLPGFSEAKVTLKENETMEALNESATIMGIFEADSDEEKKDDTDDNDSTDAGNDTDDNKETKSDVEEPEKKEEEEEDPEKKDDEEETEETNDDEDKDPETDDNDKEDEKNESYIEKLNNLLNEIKNW